MNDKEKKKSKLGCFGGGGRGGRKVELTHVRASVLRTKAKINKNYLKQQTHRNALRTIKPRLFTID